MEDEMNSVILIGRLARNPELNYTSQQKAVCKFTLAVDRPKRNSEDGGADFIHVVVWDKQAENCNRYLSKGRQCAVMGRIQTGSYKNRNGETAYTTDVVADRVEFLGGGQEPARRPEPEQFRRPEPTQMYINETGFRATDDGIPF